MMKQMHRTFSRSAVHVALVALVAALASSAPLARSQGQAPGDGAEALFLSTLDEAVVTGPAATSPAGSPLILREEAVQQFHTPSVATRTVLAPEQRRVRVFSTDTFDAGELRAYQRYGIEDVLRQTAGVSVVSTGQAGSQTSLFIRGMESNHAVVLLNGRRLPPGLAGIYQLEFLETSTLDSVQIHRGAVSSLYGSDALAGAIDLRSTDARFVESDSLVSYFEGGSFDTFRTGHKGTLRDGRLRIALDASYHETANDRPRSAYDNSVVRGNVAYELGDGVFLDVLGYIQDATLQVPGSSLGFAFPEPQLNQNQSSLFSPRFSIARDDWDFSVFYSHTRNELVATRDLFFLDNRLDQTGHEVGAQLTWRPREALALTLGGGHYDYAFERTPLIPGLFNAPAAFSYGYSSVFAQAEAGLPLGFDLVVSGRHDEHDSFASKATYAAQLSHTLEATGTTLHGKVATGYKAPSGQDFIFLDPTLDPGTIPPEESFTRELGIRQGLFDGRSSFSFAYFWNDAENLVDVDPFTFFDPAIVDTRGEGFEAELRHAVGDGLTLYANYTRLRATVLDGFYLGGFGGVPGDRLVRRPEHTLAAGALLHGDGWTLGAELRGAYRRFDAPGTILDDYTVARLFGSYELRQGVELYGRIENVFDLDYEHTTGFEAAGLGAFAGLRLTFGQ